MTSNTTNLGASSPLPKGGKSFRIPFKRTASPPLKSNVRFHKGELIYANIRNRLVQPPKR